MPFSLAVVVLSYVGALLHVVPTVQAIVGLPTFLFLPGYALLLALFPGNKLGHKMHGPASGPFEWNASLSLVERLALSFGMSIALLPVIGLVLLWVGLGLDLFVVLSALSVVTIVGIAIGEIRRRRLQPAEQFHIPVRQWYADVAESFGRPSRIDSLLNVALAVAIVFAVASLGYAVVDTGGGESYSSLSLLTQDASGEFVAADYPSALTAGEQTELFVSVSNFEGEATSYTLVAELQRVEQAGGETTVVERQALGQQTKTVADGGTWRTKHNFVPALTGENLRLTYYLYEGEAPAEPSTETAYRSTYIWLTVNEDTASAADETASSVGTESMAVPV
ncbi:hypothetical protein BM92_16880 (plasmid) [Haloferax mediterranei ATCC 33500]|uniref:DUF1616 domain-containing protein n=1 Tax=Haloferax mediterranei (strain ATCC 33500 / DSM 1411 / JCM 8866 / NBRC 14739 / NCIMB 2177 / R-4) TaxID=523841 RepID=A0A059TZL8_HALMT|nr:hypothetical protein BM92_16880 [Haloferax mediterranei ATCC 33500]